MLLVLPTVTSAPSEITWALVLLLPTVKLKKLRPGLLPMVLAVMLELLVVVEPTVTVPAVEVIEPVLEMLPVRLVIVAVLVSTSPALSPIVRLCIEANVPDKALAPATPLPIRRLTTGATWLGVVKVPPKEKVPLS